MLIDHGFFTLYDPGSHPLKSVGALFLRNAEGIDWYQLAHDPANKPRAGRRFVMVIDGSHVSSVGDDAERMWPIDCRFLETDDQSVDMGYSFDGASFAPPPTTESKPVAVSRSDGPADVA